MTPPIDLRIEATKDGSDYILTLTSARGLSETFRLSHAKVDALRVLSRSLASRLKKYHDQISTFDGLTPEETFVRLDNALLSARAIGNDFIRCFWTDDQTDRDRWEQVLSVAFALRSVQTKDSPAHIQLIVARVASELLSLPVELLPIMDPHGALRSQQPIVDADSLRRALLVFPAYATIVTRRFDETFSQANELLRVATGRVPVKVICNDSFYVDVDHDKREQSSEVEWLRTQHQVFVVEPPWPSEIRFPRERDPIEALGKCLLNPRLRFDAQSREWSDQVQHFSCHFNSSSAGQSLGLRKDLELGISPLYDFCNQKQYQTSELDGRPLVFLNACGSGGPAVHGGDSLTDLLVNVIKSRAVVATLTPVAFSLAASFARSVYRELMRDKTLGEALRLARWSMVESGLQPFGLLYVLFGNPQLHITPDSLRFVDEVA